MSQETEMLASLGLSSLDELFVDVPEAVRIEGLRLPAGRSELEVVRDLKAILAKNLTADDHPCFLGAGISHHFIPAAVRTIVGRSEFLTSYTPYQPEISQGMLQALFEYQSYIAELTGLDAVNSSNYDASTALGEAATMCYRLNEKKRFLVPEALSWEKKSVLSNYVLGLGLEVVAVRLRPGQRGAGPGGHADRRSIQDTCGIYVEVPNFFGVIDAPSLFPEAGVPRRRTGRRRRPDLSRAC